MTDALLDAINAPTPTTAEMDALIAKAAELADLSAEMTRLCIAVQRVLPSVALSRASLDMTRLCLDVQALIPPAFGAAAGVGAAAAAAAAAIGNQPPPGTVEPTPVATTSPAADDADQTDWIWTRGIALTPDQLDASFAAGVGDDLPWHVVTIGREPGLYASVDDANQQITGVPHQFRQKKDSRLEALAFYRLRHAAGKVQKWVPVPPEDASASS